MAWHFDASPNQDRRLFRTFGEDESGLTQISGGPSTAAYWNRRSPGLPMLINGSNLFEYGSLHFSYLLDAYNIDRGALHFSYILGGIIEVSFSGDAAATSPQVANAEINAPTAASAGQATGTAARNIERDQSVAFGANVVGAMTGNATLQALMEGFATAGSYVVIAGREYPAWCINTDSLAASRYTNFAFNSFGNINGFDFAANSDGLFQLGGATDNGVDIEASIMLGRDMRRNPQVKRSNRAYLHGTSDNKMEVRIVGDDGQVFAYKSELDLSEIVEVQRVKLGRGLSANYWQIEVRNVDGGQFELERIEFVNLNTTRKIKR